MITKATETPEVGVVTGVQSSAISISYGDDILCRDLAAATTYTAYRLLAKDPTLALGSGLLVSGILAGSWSVESDEDVSEEIVASITKTFLPLREQVIQNAVALGRVNFGWMPFEKIFDIKEGRLVLTRVKALLHDITNILVDAYGNFVGYRQHSISAIPIDVPLEKCLHIAFGVEGGNLYGTPLLENVRATQAMWDESNDGAKRYDSKVAGSHWCIKYPPGSGTVGGETMDNGDIAKLLLAALESSGSIAIPTTTATVLQELINAEVANLYAWQVDLLSDASPRQPSFVDRLKYLDALKIRGLILPERSMLEGSYGTLAEAQTHVGLAITGMQEIDKKITMDVNIQAVDQLLALNWGPSFAGKVRLVATPLVDTQIAFLRELYLKALATLDVATIDTNALKEKLSLPIQKVEAVTEGA